jgi:hypothetical protein
MECIPPLVKKLEKMLALLPQYTVPLLVKRMLALVILTLTALKNELQVIIAEQQAILASATLASLPGNELLQAIVDCATTNADTTLANMQSSMKPLGALLDVVNIMLELIGSDPITGVPDLQGGAEEALKPIDDFIAVLRQAEAMIPG